MLLQGRGGGRLDADDRRGCLSDVIRGRRGGVWGVWAGEKERE